MWKTKREVRKLSLSAAITVALKPPSLWGREKPAQGLYTAWWVRVGIKEYINAICHSNQLQGPQNVCKVLESIQRKTNLTHSTQAVNSNGINMDENDMLEKHK